MATPTARPRIDLEDWAAATDLGRRVFNFNYRMTGSEIRGYELVNIVDMRSEPDLTERVYMWEKKGSDGKQLIRVGIAEAAEWRRAQAQLQSQLGESMRPDIPRGTGKLAKLGDISFAAGDDRAAIAAVSFVRGNLSVTVDSAGSEPVDVAAVATSLDRLFSAPPKAQELAEARVVDRSPAPLEVPKAASIALPERLPEPVLSNGWLKVIVPDGEIGRDGDRLIYRSAEEGTKRIEQYLVIQDSGR
jgi:hypothetical protein